MILENQKQIDDVKQYHEILRTRQQQIIEIIKDTSQMLSRIDSQQAATSGSGHASNQDAGKNSDNGIRLAFSMINALANILDEQIQALNVSERILLEERTRPRQPSKIDYGFQDYYEITTN